MKILLVTMLVNLGQAMPIWSPTSTGRAILIWSPASTGRAVPIWSPTSTGQSTLVVIDLVQWCCCALPWLLRVLGFADRFRGFVVVAVGFC